MEGSQKYRDEAARLRLKADLVNDPEDRCQLLDIADQYDRLAATLDGTKQGTQ
jgi:hypothetical protein